MRIIAFFIMVIYLVFLVYLCIRRKEKREQQKQLLKEQEARRARKAAAQQADAERKKELLAKIAELQKEQKRKAPEPAPETQDGLPADLMVSQLAALYLQAEKDRADDLSWEAVTLLMKVRPAERCRELYIQRTVAMGVPEKDAEALFEFECDVLRRYPRKPMLDPGYTRSWIFGLQQRFFLEYPREKADIKKEKSLTLGELCKIIDEAEWHFWNSHERALPDGVWGEIAAWRLQGPGGGFTISYCEDVCQQIGVPMSSMERVINGYGSLLSKYKWG